MARAGYPPLVPRSADSNSNTVDRDIVPAGDISARPRVRRCPRGIYRLERAELDAQGVEAAGGPAARTLAASTADKATPTYLPAPEAVAADDEKPAVGYPTTCTEPLLANAQRCSLTAKLLGQRRELLGEPAALLDSITQQSRRRCWVMLGSRPPESVL